MKLIEALEGLEMKEGDDFPQGDKMLRKEDHQAFLREFIFDIKDGKFRIVEVVAEGKDDLPAGLHVRGLSDRRHLDRRDLPGRSRREGAPAPVLRTEGLTIRFGGLTALNNVNFEVGRGEIRAIIGPNGAGKSTFFNCLTGVLRPTSGAHPVQRRGHHRASARPHLAAAASRAPTRSPTSCPTPPRSRTSASPPSRAGTAGACSGTTTLVSRPHRQGARRCWSRSGCRQGRRARRQPVARRAAQPRDRHRARDRAAAALPRRADRRHERGRDPRDHGAGAPDRQGPDDPDRRARHAGGDGAAPTASPCCTTAWCWPRERPAEIQQNPRVQEVYLKT